MTDKNSKTHTALTIAGSDPSGGAGLQADLKTFSLFGVYGMAAVTCLTVGNTEGVTDVKGMEPEFIRAQIQSVVQDIEPAAIKTGMLFNDDILMATIAELKNAKCPIVVDPVMTTKRGDVLLSEESQKHYIEGLIPIADVVTPNIPEAALLTGHTIKTRNDMENAAKAIHKIGCKAVIVKGGHLKKEAHSDDLFFNGEELFWLKSKRHQTQHTHGTGDALSAAITALLARGISVSEAVKIAKQFISTAIQTAPGLGKGQGPVNFNIEMDFWES